MSGALLCLDLGTTTGWALRSRDGVISTGVQSFRPGRFDGAGMRYLRFKRWLTELKGPDGLSAIYFEEVRRHMGVDAAHCYGGFMAVLMAWCEHHEIPYSGIPVGTIKRAATGKGNADKPAMIAAARARGYNTDSDDEADAIALLHHVIDEKLADDGDPSRSVSSLPANNPFMDEIRRNRADFRQGVARVVKKASSSGRGQ